MTRAMHTDRLLLTTLVIVLLGVCSVSVAGDYESEDFSLRFPAALSRFSTYGDVAAEGGASAASEWSTSVNPASMAWRDVEGELGVSVCPQWTTLGFDNGTDLDVFIESVTYDADEYGTFIVGAAQISSDQATQRDGLDFQFSGDMYQAQWARKFTEKSALGAAFSYTKSVVRNDLMTTIPVAKSDGDAYALRAGGLHQATEKCRVGAVVDYGWSSDRTAFFNVPAIGLAAGRMNDHTYQVLVRPGVVYDYMKVKKPSDPDDYYNSSVYLDYQWGVFWNDTGTLNVHRVYTGVDHGFTEYLFGRAGTAIDGVGNVAWTAGVGFYPSTWFGLDAAYQAAMFPEIKQEFGWSETITVSLSFVF